MRARNFTTDEPAWSYVYPKVSRPTNILRMVCVAKDGGGACVHVCYFGAAVRVKSKRGETKEVVNLEW